MIGNNSQRGVLEVFAAGFLGGCLNEFLEQIDLVVAVHTLQHSCDALETHTGVHTRLGKGV